MYWILAIMATIAAAIIALLVGGLVTPATYRLMLDRRRADDDEAQ